MVASEEDPAPYPACDPDPDSYLCIPESSFHLLRRPVQDFSVLPGSCWWDASAHGTQLWETQYQFCIYCFISLIVNVISITSVISKAVFIFNL